MSSILQLISEHLDVWTTAESGKKSGRGRSSGNGETVYGVKKLRELILELAVRGKLVPQDAKDEPASELLKRIQAEKAKLVVEGKIRSDKPFMPIGNNEKPFELPPRWCYCRLGEICIDVTSGSTPPQSEFISTPGIPYLKVYNIRDQKIDFDYKPQYVSEQCSSEKLRRSKLYPGDVVMNIVGPPLGKIAIIPNSFSEWNCNQAIAFFRPVDKELNKYIYTYLCAGIFLKKMELVGTAGQDNISITKSQNIVFPMPPAAEQHRIVGKIDELMALCDQLEAQHNNAADAHEKLVTHLLGTLTQSQDAADFNANWQRIAEHFDTLFTTEHSIDTLKQALLQLAVMGKLVPQDPNDEPASELLKRIQAEKAKLIAAGKIKKEKPLPPIAEDEKPFELPEGWEWVRFADYANDISTGPFGSMIHQSDYVKNGVPLINPSHMVDDRIVEDCEVSVSKNTAKTLESYTIYNGDIVMARRGEAGRVAVVTERENGWLCGTGSFVLRFGSEIFRDYLKLIFRCAFVREYLAGEAVGTTMVNLNHGILKKMPLGIPPQREQRRIFVALHELLTLCDHLKSRITDTTQLKQKLANALVEQATN